MIATAATKKHTTDRACLPIRTPPHPPRCGHGAKIDAHLAGTGRKVLTGDDGKALLTSFTAVRNALDAPGVQAIRR